MLAKCVSTSEYLASWRVRNGGAAYQISTQEREIMAAAKIKAVKPKAYAASRYLRGGVPAK